VRNVLYEYLSDLQHRQRIAIALSRGAVMREGRRLDLTDPGTWEFSGFSQNGEDGVLELLVRQMRSSVRYFIEIGAADGMQNNSTWLLLAHQFSGLMVEGDATLARRAARLLPGYAIGTEVRHMFVTRENAPELVAAALHADPDILSLDIDGNDFHVCQALLDAGLRPRICVVEYNSAFGPVRSMSVSYQPELDFLAAHPSRLYYGVSLAGWKTFFKARGYQFVTVERNGVNAFFVDPAHFDPAFLDGVRPLAFAGNRYQDAKFRMDHEQQFRLIADRRFLEL
jgi:hypothetical protein